MRLDMISPHFCTKYQCSRKAAPALPVVLAHHADQGTVIRTICITANLLMTTNARLSTLVLILYTLLMSRK